MNRPILAKSVEYGGTLLLDHLQHVAIACETIAQAIGCDSHEISLAKKAGYLHDIGKVHPHFQGRLYGNNLSDSYIPLRHEISSLLFLSVFPAEEHEALIEYVVAHHKSIGVQDNNSYGDKGIVYLSHSLQSAKVFKRHSDMWSEWMPLAIDILQQCGIECSAISLDEARRNFDKALEYCETIIISQNRQWSKRKGIMVAGDHLASAIQGKTSDICTKLFQLPNLKAFRREHELYPLSMKKCKEDKKHTLVKAPTGAGKTDFLMRRCKARIFYTLPFQASINAMYDRFKNAMPDLPNESIQILHATSVFKVKTQEEKALQSKAGASVKILTPHQLLSIITGGRGFEAISIDLMANDIILDEVHCYNPETQSLIMELLRVLVRLDCRIHIGTATLPRSLEDKIIDILGEENIYQESLTFDEMKNFNRHIVYKKNSLEECLVEFEKYKEGQKSVKCLIVCNRVDRAQKVYQDIQDKYAGIPTLLLHSRFKRQDRAKKERELHELFNSNQSCIVVSTQVVEVSLDISADIMITECAPLDALVQRFGRVHRKRTNETIGTYKPVYVIAPPESASKCKPYQKEILEKSFEILDDGIVLEENTIQEKLNFVYPTIVHPAKDVYFVWKNDMFELFMLCHYSHDCLSELLSIESRTVVLNNDTQTYKEGNGEIRTALEIPVPATIKYKKITEFGTLEYGSFPLVVSDELYTYEHGLRITQIDNLL
ncbi:MAG TPA: CRISPR-associated helicase Cas3' [Candidatus Kapabacteria bacterium]|nr:CRISPR-associated helicase Cas3' [Candidatus Kapabacteria bacterium]